MIVYSWLFFLLASCTFCIVVHYRKTWICRVPKSLPCAFFRAHDKDTSCRVPQRKHTAKRKHSANPTLRRVPSLDTRQTLRFVVCRLTDTRRRFSTGQARAHAVRCRYTPWRRFFFVVCLHVAHGKAFFSPCAACLAHSEVVAPDVSVCRVPRETHGEKLLLPCASPLAHDKNQPLPYASLQQKRFKQKRFAL